MGIVDIYVLNGREIHFKSDGLETDIGSRLPSATVGMDLGQGGGTVRRRKVNKKKPARKRRDDFSDVTSLRGIRW